MLQELPPCLLVLFNAFVKLVAICSLLWKLEMVPVVRRCTFICFGCNMEAAMIANDGLVLCLRPIFNIVMYCGLLLM